MPLRRIFISHSTKDATTPAEQAAREVQEALVKALEKTGDFGILIDRLTLQPGDAWRARINLWVGGCDAAVVLLSQAALDSPYVAYESSILSYRDTFEPDFVLVPVFVPPVDLRAVSASALGSVQQVDERQYVSGGVAEIVDQVLERLRATVHAESPVERRARMLAELLEDVPAARIQEAARLLDMDHLDAWIPGDPEKLRLRLAVQLMSVGMQAAGKALLVLRDHLSRDLDTRTRMTEELLRLIASSWVDHRSAARIPSLFRDGKPAALRLNAERPLTAHMYAICALADNSSWYFASCNGVFAENPAATLEREVRGTLVKALDIVADNEEEEAAELLLDLDALEDQPILVTLDSRGITSDVLAGLRAAFPHVVYFLLAGADGVSLSPDEVEVLIPGLQRGDEEAFIAAQDRFYRRIRVRHVSDP
ncbi:MAG TPA: toll/interleukin-1 receptor domain-containing protein [Longimicrobium sp.]|nr:toll/interleukin-1 receptor domain-containing protein [Longimicrobium sp.]